MKELLMVLCCVFALNSATVKSVALENEKVRQAESLCYGGVCVVAVVSTPLYTRSERVELVQKLQKDIGEKFSFNEVIVNFDTDVFFRVKKLASENLNDDKEILDIISLARSRQT